MGVAFMCDAYILAERMNADWTIIGYALTESSVTVTLPGGQSGFAISDWGSVVLTDYAGAELAFATPALGSVTADLGTENPMFLQVLDHREGRSTLLVLNHQVRDAAGNSIGFDRIYILVSGAALPSFATGKEFATWRSAAAAATTVSVTDIYPAGTVFNWEDFDRDLPVNGTNGAETLLGTDGIDTLNGLGGDDVLHGKAGNDALSGGTGDDTLVGGAGADLLTGGLGNDVLRSGPGKETDRIDGGSGLDTVDYSDLPLDGSLLGVTVDLAAGTTRGAAAAGQDQLIGIENAFATGGGDTLRGSAIANLLRGFAGNDRLSGGDGADTLDAGSGTDTLIGGAGNDTFVTDGGDTITEALTGGTDTVRSSVTYSLAANLEQLILTGTGNLAGRGNELANKITGNSGANNLRAGLGDDTVLGLEGDDTLTGGPGKDSLSGGDGNDKLCGCAGNDKLTGGAGQDAFVFNTKLNALSNVDTITDFTRTDEIQLAKGIFAALGNSLTASEFVVIPTGSSFARVDAHDHIIYDRGTGKIYYDGDGGGSANWVLFAQVNANTALTLDDFAMI